MFGKTKREKELEKQIDAYRKEIDVLKKKYETPDSKFKIVSDNIDGVFEANRIQPVYDYTLGSYDSDQCFLIDKNDNIIGWITNIHSVTKVNDI